MKTQTLETAVGTLNIALEQLHNELTRRLIIDEDKRTAADFKDLENAEELLNEVRSKMAQQPTDLYVPELQSTCEPFQGFNGFGTTKSRQYVPGLREAFPHEVISEHVSKLPPQYRSRLERQFGKLPTLEKQ